MGGVGRCASVTTGDTTRPGGSGERHVRDRRSTIVATTSRQCPLALGMGMGMGRFRHATIVASLALPGLVLLVSGVVSTGPGS